jgi:hypothetical protein
MRFVQIFLVPPFLVQAKTPAAFLVRAVGVLLPAGKAGDLLSWIQRVLVSYGPNPVCRLVALRINPDCFL